MLGWPELAAPGPALPCSVIGAVSLGNLCFSALLACGVEDPSLGWLRIKRKSERQAVKVVEATLDSSVMGWCCGCVSTSLLERDLYDVPFMGTDE